MAKRCSMTKRCTGLLLANVTSIFCIFVAAYLVMNGKPQWGWFIFLAIVFGHSYGK